MAKKKFSVKRMVDELTRTKGMVYIAAENLGCTPQTVYNYVNSNPEIAAAKELAEGKVLDQAELNLYKAILNGEPWAIQFVLKTKGKKRGYVERQELVGGEDADPIRVVEVIKANGDGTIPSK